MPKRSSVLSLPRSVRAELEAEMVRRGFSGWRELSGWLREHGHSIGKSALHEYGRKVERRIEQVRIATEQAKALAAGAPDDEGAVAEATLRIVQQRMFDLLLAAEEGDMKSIAAAARAIAETAKAGTAIRIERRRLAEIAAAGAKKAAESECARAGWRLPAEALDAIREQVYGIVEGA